MKKTLSTRVVCFLLTVVMLFGASGITVSAANKEPLKENSTSSTLDQMQALVGTISYSEYQQMHQGLFKPGQAQSISVDIVNALINGSNAYVASKPDGEAYISYNSNKSAWTDFTDADLNSTVYLPAEGEATWKFEIAESEANLYFIKIEYYACSTSESSISSIERKLYIDGKIPFSESSVISLDKDWVYDNITETTVPAGPEDAEGTTVAYNRDGKAYVKTVTTVEGGQKTVRTYTISQDINGNSMAPEAEQTCGWHTYYCQDSTGYYDGYFEYAFENGTHTITLEAQREPVIIKSITLVPTDSSDEKIPTYAEVKAQYQQNGYVAASGGKVNVIEAEFPDLVSDSSVASANNNSSCATYPSYSNAQVYNVIGESGYGSVGQWAAYKFTVDKDGLYKFGMRYLQSALQGMYICRAIKLSGGQYGLADGTPTVPFKEAYDVQYDYSKEWQSNYLGNATEVFEFYFEAGVEYTVYFNCSLGSLKDLIKRVEDCMTRVNNYYLRVLQLTGNNPDENTSYKFMEKMPEVVIGFCEEAMELDAVAKAFEERCGKGSHTTTLNTVAILLNTMSMEDGWNIAPNMSTLKSYLGTLGTWINNSKQGALTLDKILVAPADADNSVLPKTNAGFFESIFFEISSFINSFFIKYDAMGVTKEIDANTPTVEVWIATGRDQSSIWRTMIDAKGGFTDSTGVAVNLKLVTAGTLLPSILSGKGPDVYIGLGSADVINYAIREAVVSINGKDDGATAEENSIYTTKYYTYKTSDGYTTVKEGQRDENNLLMTEKLTQSGATLSYETLPFDGVVNSTNYVPAAVNTLTLLDDVYGIPQTMGFAMMFYRMDILADINTPVPESWDDLIVILNKLSDNNMLIGLAYASAINFMLYQNGASMWKYEDNPEYAGAKIGLDEDKALEAFDYVCRLYSEHSFPISFDAANRFRTGEMPIIIGDYAGIYNQLVVYATEIAGLWEFSSLPGTVREDKTFNYDSLAGVSATVMLHGCENPFAAWQFMQWQTSAEVQANYGNRMVALIGPSAKYEAANINAIKNLSWTAQERLAIEDQMQHLSAIVNYPGSYIIDRYTKFAFLDAVNDGTPAADAIRNYISAINSEITRKREEFGLKTLAAGQEP